MPERYLVSVDANGVYLRKVVSSTQPLSGRGEGTYTAVPVRWTLRRLHEFKDQLARLQYTLEEMSADLFNEAVRQGDE